ncbi:unnamed protein product [Peronospora belbahrii]|uniref:Coilin N-terminal domain-containing protein n=1 Tax=Peronospora belbahrii TaxID=622444 RepID=A0AAU9LEV3_9STRA|nr:unnamed protein product [Peronospora belbahrii]
MDVRVRLVFVDDVGRHVQRRCGFSSCWYLLPNDLKLVGDLSHVLLREFGLRKTCPKGLELHLEELLVLATQSIRIVRDNDTIFVQCPSLVEGSEVDYDETSSSESGSNKMKLRKRKAHEKKDESGKKKVKTSQDGSKVLKKQQKCESKRRNIPKTRVESKKSSSSSSSDSSSSNSNSSENSTSSSELEEKSMTRHNRKSVVRVAIVNKPLRERRKAAATICKKTVVSNEVASKTNGTTSKSGKEPCKRRRRLRHRSGGRQRNKSQASTAESFARAASLSGGKGTALQAQEQVATVPRLPRQISSIEKQNRSNIAGVKGKLCAKTHVLFDEETGDPVEIDYDEHQCDAKKSIQPTWRAQAPELAKYGPSFSSNQHSRIARNNQDGLTSSTTSSELINGDENADVCNDSSKRDGNSKYVEKWKRPYKIVASVLDKKLDKSASSTADLTKLLNTYPAAPTTSFQLVPKDVVAFKTLTLCLETWQPVLSEWQCGQVQFMDASRNTIELSSWILAVNSDSIEFEDACTTEHQSVQINEISELRFLSGPSYSSLLQVDGQNTREIGTRQNM